MLDLKRLLEERGGESLDLIDRYVNPTFARVLRILGYDIRYVRGQGQYLYDEIGNRYIDGLAGFGTFAVGRNHPAVRDVLIQAMNLDLPNLPKFGTPALSGLLAERLVECTPGDLDTVYFANGGAESIETAIKYARAATGRHRIVCCKRSYHGLSLGALSVTASSEFQSGFGPMLSGAVAIPFNDLPALEEALAAGDIAAFIVEPIQGKGVFIPDDDYLPAAAELCKRHGALLIADEVQTGLGRTGKLWACEHWDIEPDILCTSKALSGGYVPVSAVVTRRWIHDKVFSSLDRVVVHSSTFGQNDLAMAAGLATLDVLETDGLVRNAETVGRHLLDGLRPLIDEFEMVAEVRGKGLLIALEFGPPKSLKLKVGWSMIHAADKGLFPQAVLVPLLNEHHVIGLVAGHKLDAIKFTPALTLTTDDADHMIASLRSTIAACHKFPGPVWDMAKRLSRHALGLRKTSA